LKWQEFGLVRRPALDAALMQKYQLWTHKAWGMLTERRQACQRADGCAGCTELSPGLKPMAEDPYQNIAAIKHYRKETPGIGLADATARIEEICKNGR
jgi:hypothetical protein